MIPVLSSFRLMSWLLEYLPENLGYQLTIVKNSFDPILIDCMRELKAKVINDAQNN